MFRKTFLIAWLAVAMTFIASSDAFAFHRGRRASSRPIFSSNPRNVFVAAAPQRVAVCCVPAATCCVPAATAATRGSHVCSPATAFANGFPKP